MKKGIYTAALFTAFLLGNTGAQAQAGLKKADKKYDQWAYVDALEIYEKIDKRGFASQELFQNLGNAYYFNADYASAYKHYQRLFTEIEPQEIISEENGTKEIIPVEIAPEYYYRYAQTLQNMGYDTEAKSYYNQFVNKVGDQTQIAKIRANEADLQKQIQENSGRYDKLTNLSINTQFADYGGFVHDGNLYFTSARDTGSFAKKIHTWTGAAFTSLYNYQLPVETDTLRKQPKAKRIKGDVKSILNESSAVVTKDGQTMYFTRNNMSNGTRGYDADKNTRLKIYKADWVNNSWQNVRELPINGDDFSTAHPALSKDERTLYFASDRPGGYGASDLWKVSISGEVYGVPQNLGGEINTEARETFPFVNNNNELYFSSDGRVGLGGLDVYGVKLQDDGSYSEIHNLGDPVNSNADDFAYFIDFKTKEGFFSSNREGGVGNDDIYSFLETRMLPLECIQNLNVVVVDNKTRNIITDATVTLYDKLYNEKGWTNQYLNNAYSFNTKYECGEMYRLKIEKDDYITQEETVTLDTTTGTTTKTIVLERKKVEVKKNDDLFKVLKLNPIYFDYDKDNIRPDAAVELAKVVEVLRDYPRMKIDVRSHTDSRGSDNYNLKLSERRAKSTAEWMISQGIESSRIIYKGYGETQLVNKCTNGVKCSDEQHEENRRSEFIVLEL